MNDELLFAGARVKKALLRRAGVITVLLIACLNIVYRCMSEVSLTWTKILSLTADSTVYLMSVYIIFGTMTQCGKRDYREKERYTSCASALEAAVQSALPYRAKLSDYILNTATEQLRDAQRELTEPYGISYDRYLSLSGCSVRKLRESGLSRWEAAAVKRADRLRPVYLPSAALLSAGDRADRSPLPASPGKRLTGRYLAALLPTTVFALFSAQIAFAAADAESLPALLADCLVRVVLLCYAALRGYMTGEAAIDCDTVEYMNAKRSYIESFVRWAREQKSADTAD